jgi:hypothetical protein
MILNVAASGIEWSHAWLISNGSVSKFLADCSPVYDRPIVSVGWMMRIAFKGSHFERDVILWGVRYMWRIQSATGRSRK